MKQEQCTSLPATAVDSLPTLSLDTPQLSLLSGMDTPAKSLENEQQTDGSLACECGKGTLDCSIHPSTPEKWTAFMQDSLAKILALPETKQALAQERAVASTVKSSASLAWLDQNSCSWKMSQQSFLMDSEQGGYPAEGNRNTPTLGWILGGRPNPQYTAWMMGWPLDYNALKG
jgi:hypothetical protein